MAPIFISFALPRQTSDEAGIMITKRVLPTYHPGPYTNSMLPNHRKPPETLDYVAPLEYFCVKSLYPNVDLIDLGDLPRSRYHPQSHLGLLKTLIPSFESDTRDSDMIFVDPRIWGTLVQLYSLLPPCFSTYSVPLSDTHLTQLQSIRSTTDFTLITVLDLASRSEITDDTIGELKPLTNLCVLDLSRTLVGSWGMKKLSMCLVANAEGRLGPWRLRILSLRGCTKVDDTVKGTLARFPLLSAIDLRDTSVRQPPFANFRNFPPASYDASYHPNPPLSWISGLCNSFQDCRIFEAGSDVPPHVLHINKLEHPEPGFRHRGFSGVASGSGEGVINGAGEHDRVAVLFPNGKQALHTGHGLSQVAEDGTLQRERSRQELRTKESDSHGWPFSSDREDYEGDHSGCGSDRSDLEDFEGGNSEGTISDEGRSDSEQGLLNFNSGDTGSASAALSDNSRGEPTSLEELFEPNDVAALVADRHVAEQEAYGFYRASRFPRPRSMPVRASQQLQGRRGESFARRSPQYLPAGERQRNLMFFRTPPALDSIPSDIAAEEGVTQRKLKPDEDILPKRRKTGDGSNDLPKMLLDRLTGGSRSGRKNRSAPGRSQSPTVFEKSGSQRKEQDTHARPIPVPMNPFLAKERPPTQCQSSPTPVHPTPQSSSMKKSALATPSRSGPTVQSKPTSTLSTTPKLNNLKASGNGDGIEPMKIGRISVGKKKIFDMKAWATKTEK